jgi:hypothetical protein
MKKQTAAIGARAVEARIKRKTLKEGLIFLKTRGAAERQEQLGVYHVVDGGTPAYVRHRFPSLESAAEWAKVLRPWERIEED